jgi:hypothetical protein
MKMGFQRWKRASLGIFVLAMFLAGGAGVWAIVTDMTDVRITHTPAAVHANQDELRQLVASGQGEEAFDEAFELGDDLFATLFNALDGVGANVGRGQRFTRVPRADLKGTARVWAERLAVAPPAALRATKCAVVEGLDLSLVDGLALERRLARTVALEAAS